MSFIKIYQAIRGFELLFKNNYEDKKILLITFGIILSLVILETGLRFAAWIAQSNLNHLSFSDGGKIKILCVGDSYTYGLGVERSDAYPAQLEVILREKLGSDKVEVINLGRPGMNTPLLANKFPEVLDKYHPDIVLMLIGTNDGWNFSGFLDESKTIKDKICLFIGSMRISRMFKIFTTAFQTPQDISDFIPAVDEDKISKMLKLIAQSGGLNNSYYYQAVLLGNEYRAKNMFKEAKLYYDCALKINPDDFLISKELMRYYKLALIVLKDELGKDKISEMLQSIEEQGGFDKAYYYMAIKLGNYYRNKNKFDEAKLYYDCALKINPDDFLISKELLRYYKSALTVLSNKLGNDQPEQNKETIKEYIRSVYLDKKIIEHEQEFADEVIDPSEMCRIKSLFEDNLLLVLKTIYLYGFNTEIWTELDELFIAGAYPEHAIEFYQYLSQKYPDNIDIYLRLAAQYKRVRDYNKVKEYYETVLNLDPNNQQASSEIILADNFIRQGLSGKYILPKRNDELYVVMDGVFQGKKKISMAAVDSIKDIGFNSKVIVEDEDSAAIVNGQLNKDKSTIDLTTEKTKNSVKDMGFALGIYVNKKRYDEKIEKILNEDENYENLFNSLIADPDTFAVNRLSKIKDIVLRRLKEMCSLAKKKKVKVFLLSYPLAVIERVQEVAIREDVPFVDFTSNFKSVISPDNLKDYFLLDGHCTKKGYKIMAEKVAEVLLLQHISR